MKFFKRHRFALLISFLIILLVIVSFYMLWVHVPYSKNENRKNEIQYTLTRENGYQEVLYFNEYTSDQTYHILKVKEGEVTKFVVFNEDKELVNSYDGSIVSEDSVKNTFSKEYQEEITSIEIGYEDDVLIYCIKHLGNGNLMYAYYRLDSGEWIRVIRL